MKERETVSTPKTQSHLDVENVTSVRHGGLIHCDRAMKKKTDSYCSLTGVFLAGLWQSVLLVVVIVGHFSMAERQPLFCSFPKQRIPHDTEYGTHLENCLLSMSPKAVFRDGPLCPCSVTVASFNLVASTCLQRCVVSSKFAEIMFHKMMIGWKVRLSNWFLAKDVDVFVRTASMLSHIPRRIQTNRKADSSRNKSQPLNNINFSSSLECVGHLESK